MRVTNGIAAGSGVISDDLELLDLMIGDAEKQREVYRPGRYWRDKTRSAANEIRRCGLANFRGRDNGVGLSCVDKPDVDVRHSLNFGLRRALKFVLENVYPISKAFDGQVRQTRRLADDAVRERAAWIQDSPEIRSLLERYRVPYSLGGGCADFSEIDGEKIANDYLAVLDSIDKLATYVDFSGTRTFFEIGGGYGANIHALVSNFPNIRKIVYLDIPPNLYIGTQYLRAHFPDAVVDYRALRERRVISFSQNDALEIFCIAPWQIEVLEADVDMFHNANSFVEMPAGVIENYARHIERLLAGGKGEIALISYEGFDLNTTIDPDRLPGFFAGEFVRARLRSAVSPHRSFRYYVRGGPVEPRGLSPGQ